MPILQARRHAKDSVEAMTNGMTPSIADDLRWVDETLAAHEASSELYIAGDTFTIADIQLAWTCQLVFLFKVGLQDTSTYPHIERWLRQLSKRPAYIDAASDGYHALAWPPASK